MDTVAVDSHGRCHETVITMDASWAVEVFRKSDGEPLGHLSLSCAYPWGQDTIYLFASLARDQPPVEACPAPVAELLLFPPIVPLRWQPDGFQALTAAEWEALVVTELADRPATCASAPLHFLGEALDEEISDDDALIGSSDDDDKEPIIEDDGNASVESFGDTSIDSE